MPTKIKTKGLKNAKFLVLTKGRIKRKIKERVSVQVERIDLKIMFFICENHKNCLIFIVTIILIFPESLGPISRETRLGIVEKFPRISREIFPVGRPIFN